MKFTWLVEEKVYDRTENRRWRAVIKNRILQLLSGTKWIFGENGERIIFRNGKAVKNGEEIDVICGPTGNLENKKGDVLIINVLQNMITQKMCENERKIFNSCMQIINSLSGLDGKDFSDKVKSLTEIIKKQVNEKNKDILMFIYVPKDTLKAIKDKNNTSGNMETQLVKPLYDELKKYNSLDETKTQKVSLEDSKRDCFCFWISEK